MSEARLALQDVYLLSCEFAFRGAPELEADEAPAEPSSDPLVYSTQAGASGTLVYLLFSGRLNDPLVEVDLSFTMIAWFDPSDADVDTGDDVVQSTMTFMVFPFVREFISDLTGRSPATRVVVPPHAPLPAESAPPHPQ